MRDPAIRGLLQNIAESPDENDLYLILADRLEELGEARGELIRVQLELDTYPTGTPARRELQRRQTALVQANNARWRDSPPPPFEVSYRKGRMRVQASLRSLESGKGLAWLDRHREWLAELKLLTWDEVPYDLRHLYPFRSWDSASFGRLARKGLFEYLNNLDLSGLEAGNDTLPALEELRNLRNLFLSNTQIGNEGFRHLSILRRLEGLTLSETSISNVGLLILSECKRLRRLNLSSTQISDAGLEHCQNLTAMRALYLARLPITDVGMRHLANMVEMEELSLSGTDISDDGLAVLRNFTKLRFLDLTATAISADGLAHLRGLQQLERLYLYRVPLSDEGVRHLATLKGLRKLDVKGCSTGHEGLTLLREALPDCAVQW